MNLTTDSVFSTQYWQCHCGEMLFRTRFRELNFISLFASINVIIILVSPLPAHVFFVSLLSISIIIYDIALHNSSQIALPRCVNYLKIQIRFYMK